MSCVLILGITFKENCPDVRNTRIVDVVKALLEYNINISIYDPYANPKEVMDNYGLNCFNELPQEIFDGIILGVAHKEFLSINLKNLKKDISVVYDVKSVLSEDVDGRL